MQNDPNSPSEPPSADTKPSDPSSGSGDPTASPSPPNGCEQSTIQPSPSSSAPSTTTEPAPSLPSPPPPRPLTLQPLPIHTIAAIDPKNGRLELDPAELQDLADDIATHGLLHPVTVRRVGETWQIIAGNRRLHACRRLGWTEIAAVQLQCDDRQAAVIRLHENTKRANLTPVEEACQINDFRTQFDSTLDELCEAFSATPAWLEGRLEILAFTPDLQHHVHDKRIPLGAARLLMRLPDHEQRDIYIKHAATHGISLATARLWLQESASDIAPMSNDSFSTVNTVENVPISVTLVNCFVCRRQLQIEQAIRTSVCTNCSTNIADAFEAQDHEDATNA